jgi:hypothetical protein
MPDFHNLAKRLIVIGRAAYALSGRLDNPPPPFNLVSARRFPWARRKFI